MLKTTILSDAFVREQFKKTPCVFLLGGFDGLHAGHASLVRLAKAKGLPVGVMTIVGGKDGKSLYTLFEREEIFKAAGVDFCVPFEFDEIRALSPQEFLALLTENFRISAFVCGEDFRFGKGAQGSIESVSLYTGIPVEVGKTVFFGKEKVAATEVKRALAEGDTQTATMLLGAPFSLSGVVVKDRGVGKTLRFPTANISYPEEKAELKKGVYTTRVLYEGKTYLGVTNYGARPTFSVGSVCTETYLHGFDGDLYGKTLRVEFLHYLRGVEKFDGVEELKAQLRKDLERSIEYYDKIRTER